MSDPRAAPTLSSCHDGLALRLVCVENTPAAFVQVAGDLVATGVSRIALAPFNDAASRIAEAMHAAKLGCELIALGVDDGAGLPNHVRRVRNDEVPDAIFVPVTDGETLSATLLEFVDLERGTIVIPETDWNFRCRPLFLISIPKAGTHLLYELARAFGYVDGVVANAQALRAGHWYCIEHSNSHTSARHFLIDSVRNSAFGNRNHPFMRSPALFIYRNPRDVLLSEANYYHKDGNAPFAPYLAKLTDRERMLRLIEDPWLFGSLRDRIGDFVPWLDFPNVIPVSFEELVGDGGGGSAVMQQRLIWSLQLKLQVPGEPSMFAGKVFNPQSPTFLAGQIGAWRKAFSDEIETRFTALPQDFVEIFGYGRDDNGNVPTYPRRSHEFLRRPLSVSKANFNAVPITLEYGFLGFNLVQFNGRVYALAEARGPVDLTSLSEDELKAEISAETTDILKHVLSSRLAPGAPPFRESKRPGPPQLIAEFDGYNIVAWDGRYYAASMALGPIDLADASDRERCGNNAKALFVCESLRDARETISRFRLEAEAERNAVQLHDLEAVVGELRGALAAGEIARAALMAEIERSAVQLHDLSIEVAGLRQNIFIRLLKGLRRRLSG